MGKGSLREKTELECRKLIVARHNSRGFAGKQVYPRVIGHATFFVIYQPIAIVIL
jgi:hypothetical protein